MTNDKSTVGFQMSTRRTVLEIGLTLAAVVGGVWLVLSLTGRAAGWLTDYVPADFDERLGEPAWEAAITGHQCENPAAQHYVETVAKPLLDALGPTPYTFHFAVVDDPEVNAFALPGGYVTVNIGLLRATDSGEEVAAVLAHELQHVLLRHGTHRMLRELGGTTVIYALFGGTDIAVPAAVVGDLLRTRYDRREEQEADLRGIELLKRAGLDPAAMARFFRRLQANTATPPAFLSTHPDPGDRAERAQRASQNATPSRSLPDPGRLACH